MHCFKWEALREKLTKGSYVCRIVPVEKNYLEQFSESVSVKYELICGPAFSILFPSIFLIKWSLGLDRGIYDKFQKTVQKKLETRELTTSLNAFPNK